MMRQFSMHRTAFFAALMACGSAACIPDFAGPPSGELSDLDPRADLTVLFLGNSLTASNDLPAVIKAAAVAAGRTISYAVRVAPNVSLEDHWYDGVKDLITALGADVVVLQQGPSYTKSSIQSAQQNAFGIHRAPMASWLPISGDPSLPRPPMTDPRADA
ncbi:MAG: hypothetical protein WD802_08425 [Gemmatimonadaceae bacterium]